MDGGEPITDRRAFLGCFAAALAAPAAAQERKDDPAPAFDEIAAAFDRHGDEIDSPAWRRVREQFLIDPDYAYFNTGGLGPTPRTVLDAVSKRTLALQRRVESGHEILEDVRAKACRLYHCDADELAFTRSTTEGMNTIARGLDLDAGDEVLLTTHEHPGGAMPWFALARDRGVVVKTFEPGDDDDETLANIASHLTDRTRVISISHITCTTGAVLPVERIAALCRERGISSVIDGAQAAGMIPVNLHDLECDFYACSGHKWMLGPRGTGLLYVRKPMIGAWKAPFVGAYSDDGFDLDEMSFEPLPAARSIEYGTRNTALVEGLGVAVDFLQAVGMKRIAKYGRTLADRLRERVGRVSGLEILTPPQERASIVTFRLRRQPPDPWQTANMLRRQYGIRVRPVGEHGLNGVRASMHICNHPAQVDALADALQHLLKQEPGKGTG